MKTKGCLLFLQLLIFLNMHLCVKGKNRDMIYIKKNMFGFHDVFIKHYTIEKEIDCISLFS